jgi:predicted DsbA family dithiol-disulfide isomerase
LLTAYFTDNLDITDDQALRNLWGEVDLPAEGFDKREDPKLKETVFQEHNLAIENGATGAPALQMAGGFGAIMGAQPIESYRLWFQRMLDRRA